MMNNISGVKYWSWIAAFSLSILFWYQLISLSLH